MLNDSKRLLTEAQQHARQNRQDHLEALAQSYANQNNLSVNRAILELMSHERSRSVFKLLQSSLKKTERSQMSSLWVAIDEDGTYTKEASTRKVFSNKEDIHQVLLQRNKEHLQQASHTPFAKGWLRKGLRWDGMGTMAESMLTGDILNEKRKLMQASKYSLDGI